MTGLVSLYRRLRPDLVHHVTAKPILYGTLAARIARVPAVVNAVTGLGEVFIQGTLKSRLISRILRSGYRIAAGHPNVRFIFQNEDDRRVFIDSAAMRPEQTVLIRGSGVDLDEFSPVTKRPNGRTVVILHSRMLWSKGVREFVDAARALRLTGARFLLVGDTDPDNPASIPLEQLSEWEKEGVVEHFGKGRDMRVLLGESHIACLPSYREGLPKSLIEAAAAGLPIVTTDVPGCRDVVEEGRNGFLVPERRVGPLARCLKTLIEDASLRERMGRESRKIAEKRFSIEGVVGATLNLYSDILPAGIDSRSLAPGR